MASFRQLADRVHPYGTKLFAQLFHPGANADPKLNALPLLSASPARGKKRGQAEEATGRTSPPLCKSLARPPAG